MFYAGTAIFLLSGFLPLFHAVRTYNLIDLYELEWGWIGESLFWSGLRNSEVLKWIYVSMILYPITLILSHFCIFICKLVYLPGISGVICWFSALATVTYYNMAYGLPDFQYGIGIFVGIAGAILLVSGYYMKLRRGHCAIKGSTTID